MSNDIEIIKEELLMVKDENSSIRMTNALEHKDIVNTLANITRAITRLEEETLPAIESRLIDKLSLLEIQTTKTNGRVSKLEGWRLIAVGFLFLLMPIAFYFANKILSDSDSIRDLRQIHKNEMQVQPPTTLLKP